MEVQLRRLGPHSKIKVLKVPRDCKSKFWLAGRGTSCQIYTKSKFASRKHFCITYRDHKYFISDLQSVNGTFVNDKKLVEEMALSFGFVISVGVPSEMQNSRDCIVYVFEASAGRVGEESGSGWEAGAGPEQTKGASSLERGDAMDVDEEAKSVGLKGEGKSPPGEGREEERTVVIEDEVVLIDSSEEGEGEGEGSEGPPAKVRKVEKGEGDGEEVGVEDEVMAYEALTQVDEAEVKVEGEQLNYSLTEELIEISDSEEDWAAGLKEEGKRAVEEEGEEEEEVVIVETVVKGKGRGARKFDAAPVVCKVEDDLTEVDRKWLGRLLKREEEEAGGSGGWAGGKVEVVEEEEDELEEVQEVEEVKEVEEVEEVKEVKEVSRDRGEAVGQCVKRLSRLSTVEAEESWSVRALGRAEEKRAVRQKRVSFNLVPEVRYFEAPWRPRLTASEKGRLRFSRVIFNICNWNTHWLEECKRVAPEKDPPDICDEPLRKIPKKFPSHSDYMGAFIPAMLLHLWNKVKKKWVTSGESGFRQTVSCDSFEDYQGENLCLYRCTGLVQNVEAHKELLREGHMVLLRLHQSENPVFTTRASEKYAKKLGYLVFGFVEGRTYERFSEQSLHEALEERCASIVGELHVVRLSILVKKRPNFQMDKRRLIQLTVLQWISQELRMFRGICFLPYSPLCAAILKPTKEVFSLGEPSRREQLVFKGPLDEVQSEVVRRLSYACASTESFLYSIHGAAGTGKGQVVAGLILQLLRGEEWRGRRPKVVYCTEWSVPLDEMVEKVRAWSKGLAEPVSLVRVGPIREVKPEVRELCLSNLAAGLRADERSGWKFDAEIELLKDADVVFSTCLTTGVAKMSSAFEKMLSRDRSRKVVCIIDEAMSSPERDSVIPLLLGVTHLIFVGDIYQQEPSFSGEKTHSLGLDIPLFWRIYKNFTNYPKEKRPVVLLKTQYRMNTSLSRFVSSLIYNIPLQAPSVTLPNCIENMRTHLLLVDQMVEGCAIGGRGRIASRLVRAVVRVAKGGGRSGFRVGVITCDAKGAEELQVLLPKRDFPEVEIGQLQGFQGREFEVVVFWYDGRQLLTSWLNTALTRARCSLFVLVPQESMGENVVIQKMAESAEKYKFLKYVHGEMVAEEFEEMIRM